MRASAVALLLLAAVATLSSCAFAAAPSSSAEMTDLIQVDAAGNTIDCSLCTVIVNYVDKLITTNTSQADIVKVLDGVCAVFTTWPGLYKSCVSFMGEWGEALSYILEEEATPTVVCQGLSFCRVNDTAPYYVHVALTGRPDTMAVTWLTHAQTNESLAQWSLAPGGPKVGAAGGADSTYWPTGGYWHKVLMTGLKPGTKYYYQVGGLKAGWSTEQSFTTQPATSQPFAIAIYGDMGVHNSENTVAQVKKIAQSGRINWVYHIGDISYGDDYPGNIYEYVWNQWFGSVADITGVMPYQTCPGNHEYDCKHILCAPYSANFIAYNTRFRMPGAESGSNTNMYFSFDYSYAHFISISSETDYPACPFPSKFGDQLAWLEADLQKASAARNPQRPWIIVVGHRPLYTTMAQENGVPNDYAVHMQAAFEELFHKYGVDIYFSGHEHSYERLYSIYQNKVVSTTYNTPYATTYVVSGAAGCIEGLTNFGRGPFPAWSAVRYNSTEGYGVLDVAQTSLSWKFYRSSDNGLQDSFVLTKNVAPLPLSLN